MKFIFKKKEYFIILIGIFSISSWIFWKFLYTHPHKHLFPRVNQPYCSRYLKKNIKNLTKKSSLNTICPPEKSILLPSEIKKNSLLFQFPPKKKEEYENKKIKK